MEKSELQTLSVGLLCEEAKKFAEKISTAQIRELYGITDGKAVGTYLEHAFQDCLGKDFSFEKGSSAKGLDFPDLNVDVKTTSVSQPQSSCPYSAARQKVYGLGYSLLVFVYEKLDDPNTESSVLQIKHVVFVTSERTADYQLTRQILEILRNNGNEDDLVALMNDKALPADEIALSLLADEILKNPPTQGYLTISNARQWRLQYKRVISEAGKVAGIDKVL